MMETIIADNGSRFVIAAAAVAIGLLCLVIVLWVMRNRPSSPFIRGGKNRQPRLAVLDAAAVDTRRRLVLVRRDDVEHLIMIGGPTDIVIESRIGAPAERADVAERKVAEPLAVESRPATREIPQQAAPALEPETVAAITPVRPVARPEEQPVARVEPVAPQRVVAEQRPVAAPVLAAEQRPLARPSVQAPEIPTVATASTPQANFDVAVNRPAPVVQQVQAQPIPVQPVQLQRPAPAIQQQPQPAAGLTDFERLLDAEITGDLQRLGPAIAGPATVTSTAGMVAPESRSLAPSGRQEPTLGAPGAEGGRKEPTIEEEMNRMLADISAGRKP
ncbi:flagellar biosynthetic protein FliO [Ensifer adhaerens]|uniref:flagellar biosynthetic protein FliO n=1 Tax=Ensifer adhaerens TaxID=106592 RepID=UPI001CC02650|nr:flagellar biosynthetic protein FliO [Ensifer adhaerens]MBZ7921841.1 flagellar biosynthetic protein FliO [Ensifer adhaerens]UAX94240.1 flagellar biosynthetic protein FliO [Ensifer adhaerens]UAY01875.1 flagellar biosynthetic protein FliO [Ensifer adhaerens]UAY09258.1 flagellar biosynthetic protein FliO [Ensifer adhaerens]